MTLARPNGDLIALSGHSVLLVQRDHRCGG
jgi:hypothetical protein